MTYSAREMLARVVDLFGPPTTANPTTLYGNFMVSPAGNVVVGSTTDDGVNKFQVNSTTKFYGATAFAVRPTVNGNAVWDAGNLTPGIYAILNTVPTFSSVQTTSGYYCKAGDNGAFGNQFNWYWNSSVLEAWIDTTNVGNISFTSDGRIKHSVEEHSGGLEKILKLRTVKYRFKTQGIFVDTGEVHEGLITQEVEQVIPSAVHGAADRTFFKVEHSDFGPIRTELPQPQSLKPLPLIANTINAVQELYEIVAELKNTVEGLSQALDNERIKRKALQRELEELKAKE